MRYHFIQEHRHQFSVRFSVRLQCRVLGVSVSGYYAWRTRSATAVQPTVALPTAQDGAPEKINSF